MPQAALDSVRAVTFDMYGTLLDLETSFVQGFSQFLKAKGSALDAAEVVRAWEAAYLHESTVDTLLDRGRTPFERVRRVCLSQVFSRLGIEHTPDDVEGLLTSGGPGKPLPRRPGRAAGPARPVHPGHPFQR